MDLQQKRILSENLDYFSKNINVERMQTKTRELYPKIISDADVVSLNMRKRDARVAYLLDLFKKENDGYAKLYDVLKKTSQDSTVLKLMEQGIAKETPAQTPVAPSPRKPKDGNEALLAAMQDMMTRQTMEMKQEMRNVTREEIAKQLSEFKETVRRELNDLKERMDKLAQLETAISSGQTSQEEIKKALFSLTQEFAKFKEDYKTLVERFNQLEENNKQKDGNFESFLDRLKGLEKLGNDAVWMEIRKLRQELDVLRKWTEDSCGSMQTRLDVVEKGATGMMVPPTSRSRTDVISESDIQYIAIKLGVYWEVVAKDVGIKGDVIKRSTGDEAKENNAAAAAALISEWLHKSGKSETAPPTWGALYDIVKRHDSKVAEEIEELRKIQEKHDKR